MRRSFPRVVGLSVVVAVVLAVVAARIAWVQGQESEGWLTLPAATIPPAEAADYAGLLNSPRNLVKNPDFEQGEELPENWPGGAEGEGRWGWAAG